MKSLIWHQQAVAATWLPCDLLWCLREGGREMY